MAWLFLFLAILLEVCGTTCMKLSAGFTRPIPSALIFVFYGLCFAALTLAIKRIDLSVTYAVWSGVGMALIATIGILWFREAFNFGKAISLALILAGVVGLNLSGSLH